MRNGRTIGFMILPVLLLISIFMSVFGEKTPSIFSDYDEFEVYVCSQKEIDDMELIKRTDYYELNIYLNKDDVTIAKVDKAIDNYFLSPNVIDNVLEKYIIIKFYYEQKVIRKDVSKKILSTDEIDWTITLE